ncbi:CLUMA_CG020220, isoform A [Clunio marinus]|uniref:CLUMA_CG020220, isoform A n=1 Tax=Clunio marinus TaxID=568069 RepID=A0A1J1J4B2_9DIPT|nr:CLUMA_CG020220, isoform A [Clunio marinus]
MSFSSDLILVCANTISKKKKILLPSFHTKFMTMKAEKSNVSPQNGFFSFQLQFCNQKFCFKRGLRENIERRQYLKQISKYIQTRLSLEVFTSFMGQFSLEMFFRHALQNILTLTAQ